MWHESGQRDHLEQGDLDQMIDVDVSRAVDGAELGEGWSACVCSSFVNDVYFLMNSHDTLSTTKATTCVFQDCESN